MDLEVRFVRSAVVLGQARGIRLIKKVQRLNTIVGEETQANETHFCHDLREPKMLQFQENPNNLASGLTANV